jgi:hypothetical protein
MKVMKYLKYRSLAVAAPIEVPAAVRSMLPQS